MVTYTKDLQVALFQLMDQREGRPVMHRLLRHEDAERFNNLWLERGLPARWELVGSQAVQQA